MNARLEAAASCALGSARRVRVAAPQGRPTRANLGDVGPLHMGTGATLHAQLQVCWVVRVVLNHIDYGRISQCGHIAQLIGLSLSDLAQDTPHDLA